MEKNDVISFAKGMIHDFYQTRSKQLDVNIDKAKSFAELKLTKYEIAHLVMAVESRFIFTVGPEAPASLDELADIAVARSGFNNIQSMVPAEGVNIQTDTDDDQLPPPPETIEIPDIPATEVEGTEIPAEPEDIDFSDESDGEVEVKSTSESEEETTAPAEEEEVPED